jgi:ATP:ADP antiporter, AAA family
MLGKLLFLESGDLRRLLPFFGLYLMVFAMLSVGDGMSLSLFVHKVGVHQLPLYYGITAVCNLLLIWVYIQNVGRISNYDYFKYILYFSVISFLAAWLKISWGSGGNVESYGAFFIFRELSFTLVIMHFGTFLQDFFKRQELNRMLPIVYAGGRIGGILGGVLLASIAHWVGTLNLVFVYLVLGVVSLVILSKLKALPHAPIEHDVIESPSIPPETSSQKRSDTHTSDTESTDSPMESAQKPSFWKFVKASPLLYWMNVTTLFFILCRWVLNYQYNGYFQTYFSSESEMTEFLGWYTAIALTLSLCLQLFVMNRLIAWIGLNGAHFLFALFILSCMGLNMLPMTLETAIYSRLIETEFRVGFRNPVNILMTNLFPRAYRTQARAWNMGGVIPLATLMASVLLQGFQTQWGTQWISLFGLSLAVLYFMASFGIYRHLPKEVAK